MRSKANVDIGRFILEGMMTIFIVLIFLFIVQNWVLTNTGETSFLPVCSLSDGEAGVGRSVRGSTNIIDNYKLCKIKFDNL